MRSQHKIENNSVALTKLYVSVQPAANIEAETGFEHVPEVFMSGFLLDWLAGSDPSEDGSKYAIANKARKE
jgi:hypothetical protein